METGSLVVKMIFGSHLYGTDTPDSDRDYAGVFLPTREQVLLGRMQRHFKQATGNDTSKNLSTDVDFDCYNLHFFIDLACQGQTVAIDMLHAPEEMILRKSAVWDMIIDNRDKFYTKNLKAYVGYARKQAAKYGIKGSRLDAMDKVRKCLGSYAAHGQGVFVLNDVWDELPRGEHIAILPSGDERFEFYEVCGRKFLQTVDVQDVYKVICSMYSKYGDRAKAAKENRGIDWKAVSHALRAGYEVKQLLIEKTITFPLANADYLKRVKTGMLDYTTEVAPVLENLLDELEELSSESSLPDNADRQFWDDFIISTLENYVLWPLEQKG